MVLKLPIIRKNMVAQGIWEVCFGIEGKDFKFKAGQYIKVTLPEVDRNHSKGNMREFSIISSPNDKLKLMIAFKESDSDFKQSLLNRDLGSMVEISGPFGDLILPKDHSKSIVMIAGGMGITPFLSILSYLDEQDFPIEISLIYINSKHEATAYLNLLETLKKQNSQFNFEYIQNRLTKKVLKSYLDNNQMFMVAGPSGMVSDTRINLIDLGVSRNQIILEEFTGYY